jgi:hypothetical protein
MSPEDAHDHEEEARTCGEPASRHGAPGKQDSATSQDRDKDEASERRALLRLRTAAADGLPDDADGVLAALATGERASDLDRAGRAQSAATGAASSDGVRISVLKALHRVSMRHPTPP